MNNIVCDSNIWIAFFNEEDNQHEKARELIGLLEQQEKPLLLTNYIDLECITILLKRKGIQASQRWIRFRSDAKRIEQLTFDKEDHNAITELFLKGNNKHLSFIDISLIFLATNNNQVYTFDNKLQNALSS